MIRNLADFVEKAGEAAGSADGRQSAGRRQADLHAAPDGSAGQQGAARQGPVRRIAHHGPAEAAHAHAALHHRSERQGRPGAVARRAHHRSRKGALPAGDVRRRKGTGRRDGPGQGNPGSGDRGEGRGQPGDGEGAPGDGRAPRKAHVQGAARRRLRQGGAGLLHQIRSEPRRPLRPAVQRPAGLLPGPARGQGRP